MKIIRAITKTGFVFGLAGWIYIAGNGWFHPQSLTWQLTHLTPWIREDTFGIICFGVSIVSFFLYNIISDDKNKA